MPKTSRIRHLAEVLGVDYEYLMTGNHSGQQVAGDTAQDSEGMYDLGRITRLADRLPLDVNVLEQCIEDIEAIIEKGRDSVSPKEKASIIAAMYLQRTLDDEQMHPMRLQHWQWL